MGVTCMDPGPDRDPSEVYASSYRRLVSMLVAAGGSTELAEDVVQEAFIRLIQHWNKVSAYDDPEAWVRLVAFRLLARRIQRAKLSSIAHHKSAPAGGVPHSSTPALFSALDGLSTVQRQVIVMHHVVGYSVEEIAGIMHVPQGTVKSRLARAREKLAHLLEERDVDHARDS
jgi:RNA polymerase sigma-70 factor, ECF subfamily